MSTIDPESNDTSILVDGMVLPLFTETISEPEEIATNDSVGNTEFATRLTRISLSLSKFTIPEVIDIADTVFSTTAAYVDAQVVTKSGDYQRYPEGIL